jgi:hypothetical protein
MNKKGVMKNVILGIVVVGILSLTEVSAVPWDGSGTQGDPYQISNCTGLQNMSLNLSSYFELNNSIDCSDSVNWNGGSGFVPVGNSTDKFTGSFDGQNYTITNLFINRSSENYVGLFGYTDGSNMSNVGLTGVDVNGDNYVGGLVGMNYGSAVDNSYSGGNVNGDNYVGGLVGWNEDTDIESSYSVVEVTGLDDIGGLTGMTFSSVISNSYAAGSVTGDYYVGGLVGSVISSDIIRSYAIGNVAGSDGVGGFVGNVLHGNFNDSFATGSVDGSFNSGGLMGYINGSVNINNVYWYNDATDDVEVCIGSNVSHACNSNVVTDEAYFYDVSNAPLSSWNYSSWGVVCDDYGYPSLEWQGLTSGESCLGYLAPVVVEEEAEGTSGGGGCLTTWNCDEWNNCINGQQTRDCTKEIEYCYAEEIETTRNCKEVPEQLFDIEMDLEETLLLRASDLEVVVEFFSFGTIPTFVNLTYIILDWNDDEVYSKIEGITVTTQEVLRKTFLGLELPEGKYTFVLETLYGDDVHDEFRQEFEISKRRRITGMVVDWTFDGGKWWIGILVISGIIVVSIIYFMRKRIRRKRKTRRVK